MEVVSVLANFILVMVTVAKIRKTYPSMAIRHYNMISRRELGGGKTGRGNMGEEKDRVGKR